MAAIKTWDDICALEAPTIIDFNDLSTILVSEITNPAWQVTGWALDHDPAFEADDIKALLNSACEWHENTEIMGGVEINNVTFAFLLDPSDGYRSYSSQVLVVPNMPLKTRIPRVPVRFKASEKSVYDSDVSISDLLIDAISVDTNKVLLKLGTDYSDDYYPSAVFQCNVRHMHEAAPFAEQKMLEDVLSDNIRQAGRWTRKM